MRQTGGQKDGITIAYYYRTL